MARYTKTQIVRNASKYYEPLRESRGLKSVEQYATPVLHHPTRAERVGVKTTKHVWVYGDRLYNLAHQYYNDPRLWWVIAHYNGYPTEAHIPTGATLWIPLSLDQALNALRA